MPALCNTRLNLKGLTVILSQEPLKNKASYFLNWCTALEKDSPKASSDTCVVKHGLWATDELQVKLTATRDFGSPLHLEPFRQVPNYTLFLLQGKNKDRFFTKCGNQILLALFNTRVNLYAKRLLLWETSKEYVWIGVLYILGKWVIKDSLWVIIYQCVI